MLEWLRGVLGRVQDDADYEIADVSVSPETDSWHPSKPTAYDSQGLLPNLSDTEVEAHLDKEDREHQIDAGVPLDHDGDEG